MRRDEAIEIIFNELSFYGDEIEFVYLDENTINSCIDLNYLKHQKDILTMTSKPAMQNLMKYINFLQEMEIPINYNEVSEQSCYFIIKIKKLSIDLNFKTLYVDKGMIPLYIELEKINKSINIIQNRINWLTREVEFPK